MFALHFLRRTRAVAAVTLVAGLIGLPPIAHAQNGDIAVALAKHAHLTADGAIIIRIHIACDPLPGVEEFQQGFAGAGQVRTGAEGESGIDGTIVCDGFAHTHTALIFPFDAPFVHGPAGAGASVIICNLVEDQQHCASGSGQRRIVITGRPLG